MSAYKYTLADARNDIGIRNVSGKCANTVEFADQINRVTRRLIKRGAWFGSEVVVKLCVYDCDIVWPRYVGTVEGIRFCCAGEADIRNNWYSILGPRCHLGYSYGQGWRTNVTVYDNGLTPFFKDITGNNGKYLRYHVVKQQDYGKKITFFGKKYGAQPLQELVDNNWVMGLTLTATNPIAQSTTLVTSVTNVTREPTQGMTYVYQVDPTTSEMVMLAQYEPNETNPQYRRSRIDNICKLPYKEDEYGRKVRTMEALVKLEFIPAVNDRDFLLVGDFDALALGIQALKLDEANDSKANEYWERAISELNFEMRNKSPGDQIVVQSRILGSGRIITNPI